MHLSIRYALGAVVLLSAAITLPSCSGGEKPLNIPAESGKSVYAAPKTAPEYWPTKAWRVKTPAQAGLNADSLKSLEDYAFARKTPEEARAGVRTDGLVIVRGGYLVYERYAGGYGPDTPHITWSVSKSFINALYGIAVKEGRVKVEDPAFKYYPALDRGKHRAITVDMLLRMSSGLYVNEDYEASPLKSTVIAMLYTKGRGDMAAYAASQDMEAEPGAKWEYASSTTNILSAMLRNILPAADYDSLPWKKLFDRIGMASAVWERDGAGTFVGSSYLHATPRDMAKFGFLYLNDGVWAGERLLPEGWVAYSTTVAPAYLNTPLSAEDRRDPAYGAQWWLNRSIPARNLPRALPDVPEDAFMCMGHWGQYIAVIPSLDMVVAYTGDNRDGEFNLNTLLKLVAAGAGMK